MLIKENNIQRNFWELGRITELVQGSDGEVRTVFLKNSKGNIIQRSVKNLYPLELSSEDEINSDKKDKRTVLPRKAKTDAKIKIQQQQSDDTH